MQPPDEPVPAVAVEARRRDHERDEIEVIDDIEVIDEIGVVDDIDEGTVVEAPRALRRPVVDPRIRARRIEVAREQGRRRLRVVLVALSLVVIVGTAWLVVHSPFLDVDHIVVTGVPPERIAAVITGSGVHLRDPLLLVSTGAVARRVERVPGIGRVRVSRQFPGTLRISASEQGVALWVRVPTGGVALVGYDGRVQRVDPAVPVHVLELRGLKHVPAPGEKIPDAAMADVLSQLPPVFGARVGAISAVGRGDVRLYLTSGGEVRLGDLSALHAKGVVAEAVIERMGCVLAYVDVRSISNPVASPARGATCNP